MAPNLLVADHSDANKSKNKSVSETQDKTEKRQKEICSIPHTVNHMVYFCRC